jgi:ribonuclease HI
MPDGLKNVGCTFSRMIEIVLHPQLRRNILAYVDDIVVKSTQRKDHISDLAETFANLRAVNLKLNPEKCVFGIHKGKVLGCLVSTKGIEADSDKIKALIEMQDPVSSPTGVVIRYAARLDFADDVHSTNNTIEYEALLLSMRKTKALGQQTFIIKLDSKVIQEHIEKETEARNLVLMKYLEKDREMEKHFKGYSVHHVPRNDKNEADKTSESSSSESRNASRYIL